MPVKVVKRGNRHCVEEPDGTQKKCYDNRSDATDYARAINANIEKMAEGAAFHVPESEYAWDEKMEMMSGYEPRDGRFSQRETEYTTLSTVAGNACANCRFFQNKDWNPCLIVKNKPDPILATGWCNRWEQREEETDEGINIRERDGELIVRVGERAATKEHYEDEDDDEEPQDEKSLKAKAFDILKGLLQPENKVFDTPMGFKLHPTNDNRWYAWWTNNFEDRDKQLFSEASIDRYIKLVQDEKKWPYPELWFGHMENTRHGVADVVTKIGHFAFATGTFDDPDENWLVDHMKSFYRDAKSVEVSHGFWYDQEKLSDDGVYDAFLTFEISALPTGWAANPYTSFDEVTKMSEKGLSERHRQVLKEAGFNDEFLARIEEGADMAGERVKERGVRFKTRADELESDSDADTKSTKDNADVDAKADANADKADDDMGKRKEDDDDDDEDMKSKSMEIASKNAEAIEALGEKVDALATALNQFVNMTPRGSRSKDTQVDNTDQMAAFLKQAQGSTEGMGESPFPNQQGGKSIFDIIGTVMQEKGGAS